MVDLTTLEGAGHPRQGPRAVQQRRCAPTRPTRRCPSVAAVCVYPDLVADREGRAGRQRRPHRVGRHRVPVGPRRADVKLADTRDAVAAGADEIDMVIDRGAFLSGRYLEVFEEIVAVREACTRPDGSAPTSR